MRAWILLGLAGCCTETYEIVPDRTHQPAAALVFQLPGRASSTETGELTMFDGERAFRAVLDTPTSFAVLHVPSTMNGMFTGELEYTREGQPKELIQVSITTRDLDFVEVCLAEDQNDYGTGRCKYSFSGTVDLHGVSASAGDVSGTWVMAQGAVIQLGDPDC
jgi:hypothetical protein